MEYRLEGTAVFFQVQRDLSNVVVLALLEHVEVMGLLLLFLFLLDQPARSNRDGGNHSRRLNVRSRFFDWSPFDLDFTLILYLGHLSKLFYVREAFSHGNSEFLEFLPDRGSV